MRKLLLLALLGGGGFFAWKYVRVEGWENISVHLPWGEIAAEDVVDEAPPVVRGDTIRIASFNIQVFGQSKLESPHVMQVLCDVVRRFDIVAIQEVRSQHQDVLPRFVEQINADGRRYAYTVSPPLGRTTSTEQYAFVFDTQRIEIDPRSVYVVRDPGDRLHREPLVAGFRARGPSANEAFTFTLVNIHTDPDEVAGELAALDDVFYAVRDDGRGEDDVILLGDLNADNRHLGELARLPYLVATVVDSFTNTRQTNQYDNILFSRAATSEFSGKCGVLNLMQDYQLSREQAVQVSDHFPVWAEFSVYEGGRSGVVAAQPGEQAR